MKLDFCAVCGSKDDLHLHHIDPIIHTGENRKSVKYDNSKPIKDCTPKEIFNALFDRGFVSEHATLTLCSWHHRIMHGVVTFQKINSSELIKDGIERVRAEGKPWGRPSVMTGENAENIRKQIVEMRENGIPIKKVCKTLKIGCGTYYDVMGPEYEEPKRIEKARQLLAEVESRKLSSASLGGKPRIKYQDFINQSANLTKFIISDPASD
jgi:hypothetical protein